MTVGGRNGMRVAEAEPVELGRQVGVPRLVDLVDDHDHGNVAAAQDLGNLGVALAEAGARVHD